MCSPRVTWCVCTFHHPVSPSCKLLFLFVASIVVSKRSDRFQHLIGELMIAAAAKSGGDLNIAAMKHHQVRTALTAALQPPQQPQGCTTQTKLVASLPLVGFCHSKVGSAVSRGSWLHHYLSCADCAAPNMFAGGAGEGAGHHAVGAAAAVGGGRRGGLQGTRLLLVLQSCVSSVSC